MTNSLHAVAMSPRWTDLATWVGPTVNQGDGDGKPGEPEDRLREVRGLIVHIAEGYYDGTIAWERNPAADVSSQFIGGREDGQRAQMVEVSDRAWTQRSGNDGWLSIEEEGFTLGHRLHKPGWEKLTAAQIEFTAQLFARIHQRYGVPLQLAKSPADRGLGYHSMGAEHGYDWGHRDCPGEPIKAQLPIILARAKEIVAAVAAQEEEIEMQRPYVLIRHAKHPHVFAVFGPDAVRWLGPAEYAALKDTVPMKVTTADDEVARLAADAGIAVWPPAPPATT